VIYPSAIDHDQVQIFGKDSKKKSSSKAADENAARYNKCGIWIQMVADHEFSTTEQTSEKSDQEVQQEIQSIFRQITASVTFLPMLDGNCTFNVLVYADQDSEVPLEWGDSDAKDIQDAEKVQLRSFSTNNHKVDTLVSYRYDHHKNCHLSCFVPISDVLVNRLAE
jgi:mitotic spindle assembly checkpoint protein MAD2